MERYGLAPAVGIPASIFTTCVLVEWWRGYRRKKKLKEACDAELQKDLDSFVNGEVLDSYGEAFLPAAWNARTYREMRRVGMTEGLGQFAYSDFDGPIDLVGQDDRFNASFLEKLAAGESVHAPPMQRAIYQKSIKYKIRKMASAWPCALASSPQTP